MPFSTITIRGHTEKKVGDAFLAQALLQRATPLTRSLPITNSTGGRLGSFRKLRNRCNAEQEKEKKQYFARQHDELEQEIDGSRHWWSRAKRLSRVACPHSGLSALKCPKSIWLYGRRCSQQSILADFFAQQCTQPNPAPSDSPGAPFPLSEAHATFVFPSIKLKTMIHHLRRLPVYERSGCEILTHRLLLQFEKPPLCLVLQSLQSRASTTCPSTPALSLQNGRQPLQSLSSSIAVVQTIQRTTHPFVFSQHQARSWTTFISKRFVTLYWKMNF